MLTNSLKHVLVTIISWGLIIPGTRLYILLFRNENLKVRCSTCYTFVVIVVCCSRTCFQV